MWGKHPGPISHVVSLPLFSLTLFLSLLPSLPKPTMQYVTVPGLVSGCICPITQGFKAANHAAMPHRKVSLLSCALCLNKHLSKHLDNHFSPHLNTHTYTLTHTYYTHLACSTTHGVDLVSGQCPKPWSSRCPMWLENRENYDVNIPTRFIRRQCRVVRKWSTVLSNPFSINLSLSLNPSPPSSFSLCSTWL